MDIIGIIVTLVAAAANAWAAVLSIARAPSVRQTADRVQVPAGWMVPLGVLLGAGAIGLVAGLVVPPLGIAAGAGLVVYFVGALGAHVRARDPGVAGAVFFLLLALGALVSAIALTPP